jgi:hypothetical protein
VQDAILWASGQAQDPSYRITELAVGALIALHFKGEIRHLLRGLLRIASTMVSGLTDIASKLVEKLNELRVKQHPRDGIDIGIGLKPEYSSRVNVDPPHVVRAEPKAGAKRKSKRSDPKQ